GGAGEGRREAGDDPAQRRHRARGGHHRRPGSGSRGREVTETGRAMTPTHLLDVTRATPRPSAARGHSVVVTGHHGEILQGVFEDTDGRAHRGLVTLRCPLFASKATFVRDTRPLRRVGAGVRVYPPTKWKAARAAELTLETLGHA